MNGNCWQVHAVQCKISSPDVLIFFSWKVPSQTASSAVLRNSAKRRPVVRMRVTMSISEWCLIVEFAFHHLQCQLSIYHTLPLNLSTWTSRKYVDNEDTTCFQGEWCFSMILISSPCYTACDEFFSMSLPTSIDLYQWAPNHKSRCKWGLSTVRFRRQRLSR